MILTNWFPIGHNPVSHLFRPRTRYYSLVHVEKLIVQFESKVEHYPRYSQPMKYLATILHFAKLQKAPQLCASTFFGLRVANYAPVFSRRPPDRLLGHSVMDMRAPGLACLPRTCEQQSSLST